MRDEARTGRWMTAVASASAALLLFVLALRSDGSDWYISQTHAEIIYTAIVRFHQFPFFSFAFNGGTYFLQDPQSNLYSPVVAFITLFGPSVGVRLVAAFWGALGTWAFVAWARRRVSLQAAQIGALSWVLSMGVLCRIAVGNDMFLWHLGLPLLFLVTESMLEKRTVGSAVALGLIVGLYVLGPTFHSLIYLVLPTTPIFLVIEMAKLRRDAPAVRRTLALIPIVIAVAVAVASPKLVAWSRFQMHRPTSSDGTISLVEAIRCLVDYSHVRFSTLHLISTHPITETHWVFMEGAVALPPIATIFAIVGIITGARRPTVRRTALLAAVLMIMGIVLACSPRLWDFIRFLTHGSVRVAPRFTAIAGFALALWATLGADEIFDKVGRRRNLVFVSSTVIILVSAVVWMRAVGRLTEPVRGEITEPTPIDPWRRPSLERRKALAIDGFAGLVPMHRGGHQILDGYGLSDGFLVVGNPFYPGRWPGNPPVAIVEGLAPRDATVEHTRIELRHIPPAAHLRLRIIEPQFGLALEAEPRDARFEAHANNEGFLIDNRGSAPIDRLVIRPVMPVSPWWFWFAIATAIAAAIVAMSGRRRDQRDRSAA